MAPTSYKQTPSDPVLYYAITQLSRCQTIYQLSGNGAMIKFKVHSGFLPHEEPSERKHRCQRA